MAAPSHSSVRTLPAARPAAVSFGKLLNLVAGPPDDRPEIVRPYATTHDSTGRLLIADPGQRGVHIFDFERRKYQFLKGPKNATFASPIDVACDTNDDIYVSDPPLGTKKNDLQLATGLNITFTH